MGDAQSVPVVGEVVTAIDSGTKVVAAGACAVVGKTETAGKLLEGAGNSWVEYSEKNIAAAAVNCMIKDYQGKPEESKRIAGKSLKSLEGFVDSVPGVGHVKGVGHYIAGDIEHGNKCMYNATRSTAVVGAGMATGGLGVGAAWGGLAGIEAGAIYDITASAVTGETKGFVQTLKDAATSNDPNRVVDFGLGIAGDFAGGYAGVKYAEAMRIRYEQGALEEAFQKLKDSGEMPSDFDPKQAASDTIEAARQLDKQVQDGVVKRDGHVSTRVRNMETNDVSQGYNARARADMNVAEFEKRGTDSGFKSATNARKSGLSIDSKLQQQQNPSGEASGGGRSHAACAEHDAFNNYLETPGADTANAQVVSVKYSAGSYTTVVRCPNCQQYAMGQVPTDLVPGESVPVASVSKHVTSGCKCGLLKARKDKGKSKKE